MSEKNFYAVYGKGGSGKSFVISNLSNSAARMNKRVLQIGCDPKHDSTVILFNGVNLPTMLDYWAQLQAESDDVDPAPRVEDIIFKSRGVHALEIGGPEVAIGCGGRGISLGFEILERMGLYKWRFDYVFLDFLGDVVCGGFGVPISKSIAKSIILVAGNDHQSLYVANNICTAVSSFAKLGGKSRIMGMIINKDDGTGYAEQFCERVGINVLARIPNNPEVAKLNAAFELISDQAPYDKLFQDIVARLPQEDGVLPKPMDFEAFSRIYREVPKVTLERVTEAELY
ncbi:chlorophyllide a reductase iron protein subunit X [Heliophilum fasciatum]|uniref:nitrogenase n=1 Tax=Heliophilum fasciatum TaxID=35700 RepID=A0A4R2RXV3_9FIRM|nr:chlorophyllide a reductase iron protein subunit X [Heliophilum fasciatum]MCW2277091.1 chlorophyllide a reductase subunit X [Heliophilum fasciatum]TCP68383.1 chlorophyllide a reductase subunit X [Heliophilum fasciatum]